MLKKVIFFFQANFVVAILSLAITLLTAKYLGTSGRGYLSIILVYVSFTQLVNEIFGVGSVFFLLRKYNVLEIFSVSYAWFIVVSMIITTIISKVGLINNDIQVIFFFNVFLASASLLNLKVLLNKTGVRWYNILIVLQPVTILGLIMFVGSLGLNIQKFLLFQGIASFATAMISLVFLHRELIPQNFRLFMIKPLFKESFRLGLINQAGNLSQLVNYRASYFFIERFKGIKEVGIFSIVLSFANVIWLFAVSTGTLLGNDISKKEKLENTDLNRFVSYIKMSVFITLVALVVVYCIPLEIYSTLLTKDFIDVKPLILIMGPAILIFTIAKVLGYFFSSLGKMNINFYSSIAGTIPSIILGYFLVKEYKLIGAVISCSLSFIVSTIILVIYFWKTRTELLELPK